jgi:hypothetical protein
VFLAVLDETCPFLLYELYVSLLDARVISSMSEHRFCTTRLILIFPLPLLFCMHRSVSIFILHGCVLLFSCVHVHPWEYTILCTLFVCVCLLYREQVTSTCNDLDMSGEIKQSLHKNEVHTPDTSPDTFTTPRDTAAETANTFPIWRRTEQAWSPNRNSPNASSFSEFQYPSA